MFAAVAFAVGIGVRPRLTNVNRLFARQIAQAGILNGEPVTLRGHEYPIGQILRVLGDRAEYREAIVQRAAAFEELYPRLRRGATIAGFVVPVVLAVTFSLTTDAKLAMLGAWTVWVLLIIAFLMGIERRRGDPRAAGVARSGPHARPPSAAAQARTPCGPHAGGRAPNRRNRSDRVA